MHSAYGHATTIRIATSRAANQNRSFDSIKDRCRFAINPSGNPVPEYCPAGPALGRIGSCSIEQLLGGLHLDDRDSKRIQPYFRSWLQPHAAVTSLATFLNAVNCLYQLFRLCASAPTHFSLLQIQIVSSVENAGPIERPRATRK